MKCAVLVAIAFAFVAVQGTDAREISLEEQRSLISKAKEAIEDLKNTVQEAINNAKEDLEGLKNDASALADRTVLSGKTGINEEVAKALREIAALREEAANLGHDIEHCIGENEEAIKKLPFLLIDELILCVADQLNEAIAIITDTINAVESTIDAIKDCQGNLDECSGKFFCITKVIADVAGKVVSLPFTIVQQALKAKDFVQTIKADLETCAIAKVSKVALEAGNIVVEIVDCVKEQNKYVQ